ncbi:MAG: HAD hydrolase family protein [Verrucomicrobia bacterium]|nr:HAD hydrolase family protein [Verrucomicrobiota bacterium]
MNLRIRVLSTDFDGTLHSDFEDPPVPCALQKLIGALQNAGAVWVINTGREFQSLMETLKTCELSVSPDYLVTVEREIHVRNGSGYVGLTSWNRTCQDAHEALFDRVRHALPGLFRTLTRRFPVRLYEDAFSPLCLIANSNADSDAICSYLAEFWRHEPELTVVRNDVYGRLSHADFNKGSALAEIGRIVGVGAEETVAAGDHMNDLPMLNRSFARWLIAPDNAVEPIKELVRRQDGYVSTERYGNGVASGLLHWMAHLV